MSYSLATLMSMSFGHTTSTKDENQATPVSITVTEPAEQFSLPKQLHASLCLHFWFLDGEKMQNF